MFPKKYWKKCQPFISQTIKLTESSERTRNNNDRKRKSNYYGESNDHDGESVHHYAEGDNHDAEESGEVSEEFVRADLQRWERPRALPVQWGVQASRRQEIL